MSYPRHGSPNLQMDWCTSSGQSIPDAPAEVFLVLSGLNFQPNALRALAGLVMAQGAGTALGLPYGYFDIPGTTGQPDPRQWLAGTGEAVQHLRHRYPSARISLLGFSLGGLVGLSWGLEAAITTGFRWHRAVLVAPGICPRWCNRALINWLGDRIPGHWRLPGLTPPGYRMHRFTPVGTYRSVLKLSQDFQQQLASMNPAQLTQGLPPQFIAYSPRDELVSARYLRSYGQRFPKLVTLHRVGHFSYPWRFHHLATGPEAIGPGEWEALGHALRQWMGLHEQPEKQAMAAGKTAESIGPG